MDIIPTNELEKIKKLLRLSTSEYEAEADVCLVKAKEIAERWNLDLSEVNVWAEIKKQEEIERKDIKAGHRKSVAQHYISWLLQNHFGVKIIYSGSRYYGMDICIIGKKSDCEIATYANKFLIEEWRRRWHGYQAETGAKCDQRNSFYMGIYRGLDSKLAEAGTSFTKNRIEEIKHEKGNDYATKVSESYALMVITDKERVDKEVKKHFPTLRNVTQKCQNYRHSQNALEAGIKHGKQIEIRRPIGSGGQHDLKS